MRDKLIEQIEGLITPSIREFSLELIELNIKHKNKTAVFDILMDRPDGGITIDECASINKKISGVIEASGLFNDDFIVEVSSPGLDRPLKTIRDFRRVIGCLVRFHLIQQVENKIEHHGVVVEVDRDEVVIKKKDEVISIPLQYIHKAVQIIE